LEYTDRLSPRGAAADKIVDYLKDHGASKIKIVGHKGLPEMAKWWSDVEVVANIRTDSREIEDSEDFAKELADGWDIYINEAFGVSHRKHASLDALPRQPKFIEKKAVGLRFAQEVENLSKVLVNPMKPVLVLLSGAKEDKLKYADKFTNIADKIIIGGRLPLLINSDQIKNEKILVSTLMDDGMDVNNLAIDQYSNYIALAGTIVVNGPIGKFEDGIHEKGTKEVLTAVAASKAFKVAGGGETESAIQSLGLSNQFDWISAGGGAMLEYLATGTLPGIKAIVD
jgi:phosphoglycerate kinase